MTSPGQGAAPGSCGCADFPSSPPDGDVDLHDFAAFQRVFTGYGEGACCRPDGTCTEGAVNECISEFLATYQGHGTTCAGVTCPLPDGIYSNEISPLGPYVNRGTTQGFADDMTLAAGARELEFYDLGVYGGGGGAFNVTASLYTNCPSSGGTLISGTSRTWNGIPDDGFTYILQANLSPRVTIPNTVWMVATFSTAASGWLIAGQAEVGFTENRFGVNVPPWGCNYVFSPPNPPYAGLWANLRCVDSAARESESAPQIPSVALTRAGAPVTPERLSWVESSIAAERDEVPAKLIPERAQNRMDNAYAAERGAGSVVLTLTSMSSGMFVPPGQTIQWSISASVSQADNMGLALVAVDLVQDAANPVKFDIPLAVRPGSMVDFDRPNGISNPSAGGSGSAYGGTQLGTAGQRNLIQIGGSQNTFGEPGEDVGLNVNVDAGVGQTMPQLIAQGSFPAPSTFGTYLFRLENGVANVLGAVNPPPDFSPVTQPAVNLGGAAFSFTVGTPGTLTSAATRKANPSGPGGLCNLPIDLVAGAPITSDPRNNSPTDNSRGITQIVLSYDAPPGSSPISLAEDASCPSPPTYLAYTGTSVMSCGPTGNGLTCTFSPALENARTYRLTVPHGTGTTDVELRGLIGDVNSDGRVNSGDRSEVVAVWTGPGSFSCQTDLDNSGRTNSADRSIVVSAWTGAQNCAP